MAETLTRERPPEQEHSPILERLPAVPRSREFNVGDINQAVIKVQETTGHNINAAWWSSEVGDYGTSEEILDRFDTAYERMVWRMNKVPEERIVTLQGYVDHAPEPNADATPQQINGINIPHGQFEDEASAEKWALDEEARRLEYVFEKAEFHLNRTFKIGDVEYIVDSIWYTGKEGQEGEYTTESIMIKNVETGVVSSKLDPETVDAMIQEAEKSLEAGEPVVTPEDVQSFSAETPEHPDEGIQALALQEKAEDIVGNSPFETAEMEAFFMQHPDIRELSLLEYQEPAEPYAPFAEETSTIDALSEPEAPAELSLEQKRDAAVAAVAAFDRLVDEHPELESLRYEYMTDLEYYLFSIKPEKAQSDYELVG